MLQINQIQTFGPNGRDEDVEMRKGTYVMRRLGTIGESRFFDVLLDECNVRWMRQIEEHVRQEHALLAGESLTLFLLINVFKA